MLFDDRDSEESSRDEVSIRPTENDSGSDGQLENEVRARSSSDEDGIAIPDAGSSGSESVSLEDIHKQNKKIIGLLEDLKESSGTGSSSMSSPGRSSPGRGSNRDSSDDKGDVSELL